MINIKNNLYNINKYINKNVKIIAVSKGQSFDKIKEAYNLGIKDFGENYTKELLTKIDLAKNDNLNITWHFLGNIQSNKLKLLSNIEYIHSISDFKQLEILNSIAKINIKYFLQINLMPSDNRFGFDKDFIMQNIDKINNYQNITFIGLMCILPNNTEHKVDYWYEQMLNLKSELEHKIFKKLELSMGMSADFIEAIKYGSTYIRIGEGLFGKRYE